MPPAKRTPAKRAPRNVRVPTMPGSASKPAAISIASEAPRDTPSAPVMPVAEDEIIPISLDATESPVTKKAAKPRKGSLENRLAEAFASMAIVPSFVGDQYSSYILATRSAKFAHDLSELASVNTRVKKILEGALDGGAVGGVVFSGAAMILPLLWGRGILPSPGFDPFSAFYPDVPSGVVPHASRVASRAASRAASPVGGAGGSVPPAGAPSISNAPDGVVTVPRGAHPPISPAATQ